MNKNIIKVAFVAAVALGSGINVLNSHKDVELSDIGMENVEALSQIEDPNCTITGECWKSYVVIIDCYVECGQCGTKWYPNSPQSTSVARNVEGRCGVCGNSKWDEYNNFSR